MPRAASPALSAAFLPLTEHFAYEFDIDRQEDRVARLSGFFNEASPELRRLLEGAGAGSHEVQLLDLHGMRAREAKEALKTCTEPVCVVWFGKGSGVLREVFLEFLEAQDRLVLVDLSGETAERPQEAMGLALRADLWEKLEQGLSGAEKKPQKPLKKTEKAPETPATLATPERPAQPAPDLFRLFLAFLEQLLRWLLRR